MELVRRLYRSDLGATRGSALANVTNGVNNGAGAAARAAADLTFAGGKVSSALFQAYKQCLPKTTLTRVGRGGDLTGADVQKMLQAGADALAASQAAAAAAPASTNVGDGADDANSPF